MSKIAQNVTKSNTWEESDNGGNIMATPFICSDCSGDGTRCRCHEQRIPPPRQKTVKERIRENEAEVKANLARLRRMGK